MRNHQRFYSLLLISYYLWDLTTAVKTIEKNKKELPVCIVGGGISGLSLGNLLTSNGQQVIVFEKEDRLGGKLRTYRSGNGKDEIQVEMGAVIIHDSFHNLLAYVEKYNLTLVPTDIFDAQPFNSKLGLLPNTTLTLEEGNNSKEEMLAAASKYCNILDDYVQNGVLDYGYLNTIPDVHISVIKWLQRMDLEILTPIFETFITNFGYGSLEDTPILYALKAIYCSIVMDTLVMKNSSFLLLKEGFDTLVGKMGEDLDVKLGEEVVEIIRRRAGSEKKRNGQSFYVRENGVRVRTSLNKVYNCSKVILAFPPLLNSLTKIVPDLTVEEQNILSHVKVTKYATSGNRLPSLEKTVYVNNDELTPLPLENFQEGSGEVRVLSRQLLKHIYISYSWLRGDYTEFLSFEDWNLINKKRDETLQAIVRSSTECPKQMETFINFTSLYFPHVSNSSLLGGFYEKFNKIQGNGEIYYATTLLGFETTNLAIQMTEYIVQQYFS